MSDRPPESVPSISGGVSGEQKSSSIRDDREGSTARTETPASSPLDDLLNDLERAVSDWELYKNGPTGHVARGYVEKAKAAIKSRFAESGR